MGPRLEKLAEKAKGLPKSPGVYPTGDNDGVCFDVNVVDAG